MSRLKKGKGSSRDLKTALLLHPAPVLVSGNGGLPAGGRFTDGGYRVASLPGSARLVFDCGPLGMPPLGGHGHADALSILLTIDGQPLLTDVGTYRYFDSRWRSYFRSTRAHNTVAVDGRDQAGQAGSFIWRNWPRVVVEEETQSSAGRSVLAARQEGYTRAGGPVHRRELEWCEGREELRVRDTLSGGEWSRAAAYFHIHPEWKPHIVGGSVYLSHKEAGQVIIHSATSVWQEYRGSKDPMLGWYSPAYGRLQECATLVLPIDPPGGEAVIVFQWGDVQGMTPPEQQYEG